MSSTQWYCPICKELSFPLRSHRCATLHKTITRDHAIDQLEWDDRQDPNKLYAWLTDEANHDFWRDVYDNDPQKAAIKCVEKSLEGLSHSELPEQVTVYVFNSAQSPFRMLAYSVSIELVPECWASEPEELQPVSAAAQTIGQWRWWQ